MREWTGKRYWIVGASEGLGREMAKRLSALGVELVLSARNTERLDQLAAELPGKTSVVAVDVADSASVIAAAQAAGQIDGLVYLAGAYWPLHAKNWDADQVETMCDVNFTGCARVLGQVVPGMIERDAGHIVLTGSLGGLRGLPGMVGYAASKAGVMHMAESLYSELRKTGVDVQLVNPGFIKTRMTDKNDFAMPGIMAPEAAAREVVEHMHTEGFRKSFPFGLGSLLRLAQLLPDALYYRLFS